MSFPKAKIHRFNEDVSCAPPPGTYDPKLAKRVQGTPNQKRRLPDQQCISTSLDSLNRCNNTKLTFRTPQVVRKVGLGTRSRPTHDKNVVSKISLSSTRSLKDEKIFKTPKSSASYHPLEHQQTIVDNYESEITRLKTDNSKLQETLNEVKQREEGIKLILEGKIALSLKIQKELFEVKHNLDNIEEVIQKEREDHSRYTEELKSEISLVKNKKEYLESVIAENQSVISTITDRYLNLKNGFDLLQEQHEKTIRFIEDKNSNLMNELVLESENKMEQLEKTFKNKICKLEQEFNSVQENSLVEFQTRINYLMNHEFEPKSCKFNNYLETCLSSMKELQSYVNQNEKKYLENVKEVDERCRFMYRELCKVEIQRDELLVSDLEKKLAIMDMEKNAKSSEEDLKSYREKCKKYEIALRTMHETVNALSDRLLESENEVMRLNSLNFVIDCQEQSVDKFLISDIKAISVDPFKIEMAKSVQILNDQVHYKQSLIEKLQKKLDNINGTVNELKCLNVSNEKQISEYKSKMEEYENVLTITQREAQFLKIENTEQLDEIAFLKDQIRSINEILEKKSENEVKLQQCIDSLFSDLIVEKNRFESLELEKNSVEINLALIETSYSEKEREIEELGLKIESMDRSLKNLEERVTLTDEEKGILEMQLLSAENNTVELKLFNAALSTSNDELRNKIKELQQCLNVAKEQVKIEIPNLQRDIINKAACILELSLNIDTLTETISKHQDNISYLQAEKNGLIMQLSEAESQISNLKRLDKNNIISVPSEFINHNRDTFEDLGSEKENILDSLAVHNGVMSLKSDDMELQVVEEQTYGLEEELYTKMTEHKRGLSESGTCQEDLQFKLHIVTEERNKLHHELLQFKKLQNIEKMKQDYTELKERAEHLEKENSRLNKMLTESKENISIPQHENSPKVVKNKIKTVLSPAVLKDRNY